mgnify:CR=1 FL=1
MTTKLPSVLPAPKLPALSVNKSLLTVMLALPALGFLGLWSDFDMGWFLIASMALVGVAQGAEGDVAADRLGLEFVVLR